MGLSRRQHQFDRISQGIDEGVDFGRQSAAGSTDRLLAVFFSRPGAMLVGADNGGIDHHVFVVVIARQQFENTIENPALGPPAEALVDDFPIAKTLRKITPWDARSISVQNGFDE
jgi:hypothetical protein